MAPTYSINPGTGQEAESFTDISQILNLLPDNTQKLIAPRDVRDAVFSNWENTIIRYTTNSSGTPYIGVARKEVKDKIFIGKKELNNSSILSNSVLSANSDVDIFFYNTKSDSAVTQDLKIAFLGGSSQSLHLTPPYLEVTQVVGGTPSLDLSLTHNQSFGGDFNFIAGVSGRISLNNLVFPSTTELATMVSSPSASVVGDLYLVRNSSGNVELRQPGSGVSTTLGIPGGTTNIYGSPVNLNGFPLEFTDLNPTIIPLGGIAAGSTFSNVPLVEMIRQLLYPYLGPLTSISFTNTVFERNHTSNINVPFTYTLTKRSDGIVSSQISAVGISPISVLPVGPTFSGSGYLSNSYSGGYTFSGLQISSNTGGVFTFSCVASDGTTSFTATQSIKFVYPYFFGFYPTTPTFSSIVMNPVISTLATNGGKLVNDYGSQSVGLGGTGYITFCYPYSYGLLSTIYDGNGFLVWQAGSASTSWTYSTTPLSLNSPTGLWTNGSYRVFRTTTSVTIPLPSQSYQFNF
jgi:hypothetical protein